MTHLPAAEDFTVRDFGSVGPVVPGFFAVEAVFTQVMGVGRGYAFVVEQRVVGIDAVMAHVGFEADFVEDFGLFALGVDRQAFYAT